MSNSKENPVTGKNCYHAYNGCVLVLNILLLIVNIYILCHEAPRENLGFDYMGVIVAIFGVLVTLLVAWNIHSVVDFKNQLEKVDKLRDEVDFYSKKIERLDDSVKWLDKYKETKKQSIAENRDPNPMEESEQTA